MSLSEMFGSTGGTTTIGEPAPRDWRTWLTTLFPASVTAPFADRHAQLWNWVWSIRKGEKPRPLVAVWPRGGGKSTSAELAVTALGMRGQRRYVLYVRQNQEKADDSVTNIARLLEKATVGRFYPEHGEREVGKHGNPRGWRRNRISTAGGLTVDALGLDSVARGAKVEDDRPDLIVLDDIDEKHDNLTATAKKIATITTSILPAGSTDCAILAIQNLIISHGFFSRMVDQSADYLNSRIVSGPFPAVEGLKWEWFEDETLGVRRPVITAGEATWKGQDRLTCEQQMDEWGPTAFSREAQHDVFGVSDALALKFDKKAHIATEMTETDVRALVKMGRVFGGMDFGAWRFAFTLWAVDRSGVPYRIGEVFSQRESLKTRAQKVHELCESVGIMGPMKIWGDAANPTDIMEINLAFKRGWTDPTTGKQTESPLRVMAVANENKLRKASVERINDLMGRNAFKLVGYVGEGMRWKFGWNAASAGTEMQGSRLLWEIEHWGYPVPKEGEAQEQDPDDDTADGGDAIASMRYALMSWFKPASKEETASEGKREDRAREYDFKNKRFVSDPSFDDEVRGKSPRRYTRPIHTPRVRR